ncbi:hypothetical protein EWM64_g8660 [Hericium alpestre]|uniref:FAD-dependent oxidoreductase 2 FAD binding domain-containing protein n=1 Tax=Hericium alpestre TaxID=135208 RepID=A0A4Y9ZKS9_9AGAM|nr:hypothetical protein EWM64_g8660 [Hericium alpestre]
MATPSDEQLRELGYAQVLPPNSSGIRIIIVGCGFAGLACAIESVRKGHSVTLLEKYDHIRTLGDAISFDFNVGRFFMHWGLHERRRICARARVDIRLGHRVVDFWEDAAAGLRAGRLPLLLPGGEHIVRWDIVPLECGWVRVPRIRVLDRRYAEEGHEEGVEVEIVDARREARDDAGDEWGVVNEAEGKDRETVKEAEAGRWSKIGPILVLP